MPPTKKKLLDQVRLLYRNKVLECRLKAMFVRQEDLARVTGISRSAISAIENNRQFLSAPYALLISEALGCKLDDLYEKRNEQTSEVGNERPDN